MGIVSKEDGTVATHTVVLPVLVEADDVHKRYCAFVVRDGQPDQTFYGEYSVDDNWSGDSERQKQLAIDDLQRKIMERLRETASK